MSIMHLLRGFPAMLLLGGFPVYHALVERVSCLSCSYWEGWFSVDHVLVERVPYLSCSC